MSDQFNNQIPKNDSSISIEQLQKQLINQGKQNEQSLPNTIGAGFIAAIAGALIWGLITYAIEYQIGFMAIGIGWLVGLTIQKIGKSTDIQFGIVGGALSLFGCLFGNLLATLLLVASVEDMSIFTIFSDLNIDVIVGIFTDTFNPMDLLFYGLAVYYGFKYSITPPQIAEEEKNEQPPVQS